MKNNQKVKVIITVEGLSDQLQVFEHYCDSFNEARQTDKFLRERFVNAGYGYESKFIYL